MQLKYRPLVQSFMAVLLAAGLVPLRASHGECK